MLRAEDANLAQPLAPLWRLLEDLLASAVQAAPQQHQRVKLAERALPLDNDFAGLRVFRAL